MSAIITEQYLLKKEIDWSVLTDGFTLPIATSLFFSCIEDGFLVRGQSKTIHVWLDGAMYDARVSNVNFSNKFNHKNDIIQIRYDGKALAKALQQSFSASFNYINTIRNSPDWKKRSRILLPDDAKEYLVIYATSQPDTFVFEPLLATELAEVTAAFQGKDETEAEQALERLDMTDDTAQIFEKPGVRKMRKLNKSIGDALKKHYVYRCQICGAPIGSAYGAHIAEAHHIRYFTKSQNNDAENILICCPNHHRIIHATNPVFDFGTQTYTYPNGYSEGLLLNDHIH
ncbi:MAG: HNH endonuclease [Clostridia bacterium]|nr:HNH endonuclease [Clostridia bacterium]